MLNLFPVSPDSFQIIEQAVFFGKYVNNQIAIIHQNPAGGLVAFNLSAGTAGFSKLLLHTVRHSLNLTGVLSIGNNKIIGQNRNLMDINDLDILSFFFFQCPDGDFG